ncbi:MAG: FAD:protein FMN transferase, partial [Sulfurovum sp.]|nr:FAD:protein FMN transferase [Sulfurovum sp.]
MKYIKPILPLFLLFFFFGCTTEEAKETEMSSRTQVIMGTFCTLSLEVSHAQELTPGFEKLKEVEQVLSSYKEDALVSLLNKNRHIKSHPMLREILKKSKSYYAQTQGYFDITIGSITKKLYHFGEEEQIPTKEALGIAPLGVENIFIAKDFIRLKNNITIDLGGIGKGYGVDVLAAYYQAKGITKGQIALSGDIRCLDLCDIAIQSPFEEDATIALFQAKIP